MDLTTERDVGEVLLAGVAPAQEADAAHDSGRADADCELGLLWGER